MMTRAAIQTMLASATATAPIMIGGLWLHLSASGNLMVHPDGPAPARRGNKWERHTHQESYRHAESSEWARLDCPEWHEAARVTYMRPGVRALAREIDRQTREEADQDAGLRLAGYTDDEIEDLDRHGQL